MLEFDLSPIIFRIGDFELRWYRLMVVLAIVAVVLIASREARRRLVGEELIYSLAIWAVVGGLVVARLVHVVDEWDYYMANPSQIVGFGGLAIYGGVLGAVLATVIYARTKGVSFWVMGDVIAPGAVMGQAIGRVGCLFDGCCYGLPTSLPWGLTYTDPASYAPIGVSVHPTQAYLLVWNLMVFAVLWGLRKRIKASGVLFLLYLSLYAVGDFGIRFLREGTAFLFGFQEAQVIGLGILAVTVPLLSFRLFLSKAVVNPDETVPGQED